MLHEIIKSEVETALKMASNFYPNNHFAMPVVKISNRMTKASGRCSYTYASGKFTLTFSRQIIERNDLDRFVERTVYHEVAHMVQQIVYKEMNHARTFKYVMRNVLERSEVQSTRCHSYKIPPTRATKKKQLYTCKCGIELVIGPTQHKRIQQGVTGYRHALCGSSISKDAHTGAMG